MTSDDCSGEHDVAAPPAAAGRRRGRKPPATGRADLPESEKRKVWVRAGGVCVLCKRYLLDGALTALPVSLGELAHIVGQQPSKRSPRGDHPLPRAERDTADNVLLACGSCHGEIDTALVAGLLDVDLLTRLKRAHEARIRHVTTLPDDRRTVVLRVLGSVRGNPVEVSRQTAVATVVADAQRFPSFELSGDRIGVEIDLTGLPGERDADEAYYTSACRMIDEVIDTRLRDQLTSGAARHLSVFAFARLPVLIYLGSKLDDTYAVDLYQRHRHSQDWRWDDTAEPHGFTVTTHGGLAGAVEAVLMLNVSGVVDAAELPAVLAGLPRLTVAPDGTPGVDVLCSRRSLEAFTVTLREVYAALDAHKGVRRLHVVGAVPLTAAVQIGRLRDPHVHPTLVVYDRADGGYRRALEIV